MNSIKEEEQVYLRLCIAGVLYMYQVKIDNDVLDGMAIDKVTDNKWTISTSLEWVWTRTGNGGIHFFTRPVSNATTIAYVNNDTFEKYINSYSTKCIK